MCCTRLAANTGRKNYAKIASAHHRRTLPVYIFATKACFDNRKKLLNGNISSTCPHNMVNFRPLTAEIGSGVWGTPANFNGFRVLPSLLQRRRSPEANQTLHDVWPSAGLVHYIYIFGLLASKGILPGANSLYVQVLCSPLLAALLHGTRAVGVSQFAAWYKEWNYGTFADILGRAAITSAHILQC